MAKHTLIKQTIERAEESREEKEEPKGQIQRTPHSKYPSQIWYRSDYPTPKIDNKFKLLAPSFETHNKLRGMLGIIPRDFKFNLVYLGHEIQEENVAKKVSKVINDSALKAFLNYEHWKRHKKRTQRPNEGQSTLV